MIRFSSGSRQAKNIVRAVSSQSGRLTQMISTAAPAG